MDYLIASWYFALWRTSILTRGRSSALAYLNLLFDQAAQRKVFLNPFECADTEQFCIGRFSFFKLTPLTAMSMFKSTSLRLETIAKQVLFVQAMFAQRIYSEYVCGDEGNWVHQIKTFSPITPFWLKCNQKTPQLIFFCLRYFWNLLKICVLLLEKLVMIERLREKERERERKREKEWGTVFLS